MSAPLLPCLSLLVLLPLALPIPLTLPLEQQSLSSEPPQKKSLTLPINQILHLDIQSLQFTNTYIQNCHSYRGDLFHDIVGEVPISSSASNFEQAYTDKYGIVYLLEHQNLKVYQFNEKERDLHFIQKVDFQNSHCGAQIGISADGEFLYHFACFKITRISLRKSLADIKKVVTLQEAFYGHKVLSGDGFFVWISYSEGVRIYAILQQTLVLKQNFQKFINQDNFDTLQKITDAVLKVNRLYLLGHESTIYILDRLGNGNFQPSFNISLKGLCISCKHQQIAVSDSCIYVYSVENREEFVSELQISPDGDKVYLVRYFKGHKNFVAMEIWNGKLLTVSKHVMNLYEVNKDPRTISTQLNGVSNNHLQPILKMSRISDNLFLKITSQTVQLIKLQIKKPYIQCKSDKPTKLSISLPKQCKQLEQSPPYYSTCQSSEIIEISIEEQKKQMHLFAIVSVFLFSLTVVLVLAVWRSSKVNIIVTLVDQINSLRKRRAEERVEFVEEKIVAKQVNWSEIEDVEDLNINSVETNKNHSQSQSQNKRHVKADREVREISPQEKKKDTEELHQEQIEEQSQIQSTERQMDIKK